MKGRRTKRTSYKLNKPCGHLDFRGCNTKQLTRMAKSSRKRMLIVKQQPFDQIFGLRVANKRY